MKKLSSSLSTIQVVVEDAEARQLTDKPIASWLRKLKDAAYDVSDALDELSVQAQKIELELTNSGSTEQVVSSSGFNFKKSEGCRKVVRRLKQIIRKFRKIVAERKVFCLVPAAVQGYVELHQNTETRSSPTEPQIMYGRDGDKETIIHILLKNVSNEEDDVSIFPIVGMGGIGKTTLAQMIYDDERVASCYDVRIWVHVGDPFDLTPVLKAILESFHDSVSDLEDIDSLQSKVTESLKGRRYLLVLDDMWNEDQSEWQRLKRILNEGAKGSLAIVTTRLSTVACITGTIPNYCLQPLLEDQFWSLIKNDSFGNRAEENPKLIAIRKAIVERFRGIPQAAKSLGRLLGLKTEEKEWQLTSRSDIWKLPENKIISSLRLSSKHLSPHIRLCFAYCSMFPKGYLLEKDELICLWMANGFILSHGGMGPEDVGDAIFNELLERSFFKTEDIYGNIVACKMHDLMHDLASTLMVGEISTIEVGKSTQVQDHGHLSLICEPMPSSISLDPIFKSHPTLRALLFFQSLNIEYPFMFDFSSLRCLRALNLRGMSIDEIPPSICDLKHLRYLNLSKNDITSLPESIHNLQDLQTLNLSRNRKLTSLPLSIGDLQDLRHFNLSMCSLESLPESIQHLRNLQMLDLSGNVEITTLPLSEGDLQSLRHINLSQCSLTSLPESILSLSNLQMLDLSRNYSIMSLPMSIGMLQSLRCLNLSDCKLITSLPESLCLLTKLQAVILRRCSSLGMLPEKLGNMSSLRHLDLQGCRKLTKMPVEIGQLTYLQTLNLFTVGRSNRHSENSGIKVLEGLNQLKGELEILGLEHVNDSENARAANLKSKYFLTELKLSWGDFISSEENSNHNELEGLMLPSKDTVLESFLLPPNNNVLEALLLPPNIKQLIIHGYPWESCFPHGFVENLSGMCLRSLQISDCKRLATLPDGLEKLTSLKELRIECCNGIDSLPVMATQILHTSLLSMTIETCKSLASVSEGLLYLTSLLNLSFQHCPELEFATADFQHLISLQCLRIGWLPKLRALPEGIKLLSVLHHLEIEYCWHLRTLSNGLQYLTSLQRLKIHYCPQLHLEKEDFQNLISLQTLEIEFLPKLISLPEERHLTLLQHLKILRCEILKMLSGGVKYLTALQSLTIRNCHGDLHKKYEKEKGEDWHLISQIPHIDIENPSKDSVTSADKPQWHK